MEKPGIFTLLSSLLNIYVEVKNMSVTNSWLTDIEHLADILINKSLYHHITEV